MVSQSVFAPIQMVAMGAGLWSNIGWIEMVLGAQSLIPLIRPNMREQFRVRTVTTTGGTFGRLRPPVRNTMSDSVLVEHIPESKPTKQKRVPRLAFCKRRAHEKGKGLQSP